MNRAHTMPDQSNTAGCKFVEVLTAETSGDIVGYRFGGSQPGPNALVAGDAALMEALFERLNQLPTLPWMWGKLYLVALDDTECGDLNEVQRTLCGTVLDELVLLPHTLGEPACQHSSDRAYWTTLRMCRQLGMIQGRGVATN